MINVDTLLARPVARTLRVGSYYETYDARFKTIIYAIHNNIVCDVQFRLYDDGKVSLSSYGRSLYQDVVDYRNWKYSNDAVQLLLDYYVIYPDLPYGTTVRYNSEDYRFEGMYNNSMAFYRNGDQLFALPFRKCKVLYKGIYISYDEYLTHIAVDNFSDHVESR